MKKNKLILALFACMILVFGLTACSLFGGGDETGKKAGEKIALTSDAVTLPTTHLVYNNGVPCTFIAERDIIINRDGTRVSANYFSYDYSNNINAGEGKIVITAKDDNPSFTGSAELSFIIDKKDIDAISVANLKSYLENPNYGKVTVSATMSVEENITIPEGKTLSIVLFNLTLQSTLTNNGCIELGIKNGTTPSPTATYSTLFNKGTVVNNGSIDVRYFGKWNNIGTLSGSGTITNGAGGVIISCGEKLSGVVDNGGTEIVRQALTEEDVSLEYTSITYVPNYGYFCPKYTTNASVDEKYDNEGNAGDYTLTLTVKDTDETYYGSLVLPYTVEKGSYEGTNLTDLLTAMQTGNYKEYIFNNLTIDQGKSLDIPQGSTLKINGNLTVNGTVINNGTILFGGYVQVNADGTLTNNGTVQGTSANSSFGLASGSTCNNGGKIGTISFVGQSNATLSGLGTIYTNTESGNFDSFLTIRSNLTEEKIELSFTSVSYDGEEHKPTFTVEGNTLSEEDYTVTFSDAVNRGTVTMTITIKDCALCRYKGNVEVNYTIQ